MEEAIEVLFRDYGELNSIKAAGQMEVRLPGEKRARPAAFVCIFQRPDKIRVRAYRPLVPPLFELVSNGAECWVSIPAEKVAYRGNECGIAGENQAMATFSADAIIASFLVVSDFDGMQIAPASLQMEDDFAKLTIDEPSLRKEIWIDALTGLARRQLLIRNDGAIYADILYDEHSMVGEAVIPTDMEALLSDGEIWMHLKIGEVEPLTDISNDVFKFSPSENAIVIPH